MINSEQHLPDEFKIQYLELHDKILQRLADYKQVPESDYFYELCYCICTPQSKAVYAIKVQQELQDRDFFNKPFDPVDILSDKNHYIRFHNKKAQRILSVHQNFSDILNIIKQNTDPKVIRSLLIEKINGFGAKEASHFLRNIGFRNLAILDRHIFKHLINCNVIDEVPKINSNKKYYEIENLFLDFADKVGIPIDELDILFWSYETGIILK